MKILMIPSGYYPECCGGVEVLVQVLSEGLVSQGYEITVLCCSDRNQFQRLNGVYVIRMRPVQFYSIKNSLTNRVNRMLQMYNPLHIRRFCKIIRHVQPDVIHLHMARTLSMSILTAAKLCHVPVVSTLHEYFSLWNFDPFHRMEDVICSKPQFYVEWIRNIHRKATEYVKCVTSPLLQTFEAYHKERYYLKAEYTHITNALPPLSMSENDYYYQLRQGRSPQKFLLICRLMPFKGIEKTLELFSDKRISAKFELHIAGEGPMRAQVESACQRNRNIFYHGFVINEKKEALFKKCDVMIFLTGELETYGLVVAEAFQRYMPVIVSDVQAMRNIVTDKKNGLILKDTDKEAFLRAVKYLLEDRHYQDMVEQLSDMKWQEKYERMLSAYRTLYLSAIQQ